ncbi:hypothetical protein JOQ06_017762, partial [Pogonophryne albipinna]
MSSSLCSQGHSLAPICQLGATRPLKTDGRTMSPPFLTAPGNTTVCLTLERPVWWSGWWRPLICGALR